MKKGQWKAAVSKINNFLNKFATSCIEVTANRNGSSPMTGQNPCSGWDVWWWQAGTSIALQGPSISEDLPASQIV